MRVSMRSGRVGSAKHNDRSFDLNNAAHIDQARTILNEVQLNQALTILGDSSNLKESGFSTLEEYELDFYRQTYQQQCDITNSNYIRQGHPERCKSPDDLYHGKLTRPEELILQIGDMNDNIPQDVFMDCVNEYLEQFEEWNEKHGEHGQILDVSFHFDESSPHVHIRRVWDYIDKHGVYRLGQNKALQQAGVELPDPSRKTSRYNNRKMTFDAMMRGKWQEICKVHGFKIETEPRVNKKHKQKAQYIADCLNDKIDDLQNNVDILERSITELRREKELKCLDLHCIREELNTAQQEVFDKKGELECIEGQIRAKKLEFEAMEQQLDELQEVKNILTKDISVAYQERFSIRERNRSESLSLLAHLDKLAVLYTNGQLKRLRNIDIPLHSEELPADIQKDIDAGLCKICVYEPEKKVQIPQRILDELIANIDKTKSISQELKKVIYNESDLKRAKKIARKSNELLR